MDIMSLANDALVSYIKGKVTDSASGVSDVAKLINVSEMLPAAKACWDKLSEENRSQLISAVMALVKGGKATSLLSGLAGLAKGFGA